MLDVRQFREFIVRRALQYVGLWSLAAENLVVGTALHESQQLTYIDQTTPGPGPAYGLFQMERKTYDWLVSWVQKRRPDLWSKIVMLQANAPAGVEQLWTNLALGAVMCRLRYLVVPEPLPAHDDLTALDRYYKHHYNTRAGKARYGDFRRAYERAHRPRAAS